MARLAPPVRRLQVNQVSIFFIYFCGYMGNKQKKNQEHVHKQAAITSAPTASSIKILRLQALIVFGFAFLLYANTMWNKYAVDDTIVIVKNSLTKQGFAGIPEIMTTDAFYGFFGEGYKLVEGGRYRPLSIVTFAIEQELFGGMT